MCVYSAVVEHYRDKWYPIWTEPTTVPAGGTFPNTVPATFPLVTPPPATTITINPLPFTPEQVEEFRKDMAEMKKLLVRMKRYDEEHNEPNCDMAEKKQLLTELAEKLNVPIEFP